MGKLLNKMYSVRLIKRQGNLPRNGLLSVDDMGGDENLLNEVAQWKQNEYLS